VKSLCLSGRRSGLKAKPCRMPNANSGYCISLHTLQSQGHARANAAPTRHLVRTAGGALTRSAEVGACRICALAAGANDPKPRRCAQS
jgi:hypothetical protein